jgi:DNA-binding GntR family transcriptional regulator
MARPDNPARARRTSKPSLGRSRKAPQRLEGVRRTALQAIDGGTLTDRAYQQLEEMIVTLQLPPGTALSEQLLSQRLGIGRTPIREALQRLSREGLVSVFPRRGVLVSEINVGKQLQLLEVRREIERLLARLAAERATNDEREEFHEIAAGILKAARDSDEIEFGRLDQRLNLLEWKAARNEYATKTIVLMNGLSRRFWFQHFREAGDLPVAAKVHADLASAIAKANPQAAERASDRLIDYIESFARKTVAAQRYNV